MFCWRVVLVLMVVLALTLVMGEVVVVMALLKGSYCYGWISRISRFSCNYSSFDGVPVENFVEGR
jgi:hypothetical protein